jgi:hypothetical protein
MIPNPRKGPQFRIDDHVYFSAQTGATRTQQTPERFTIVAVMPQDRSGSFQYRIRPTGVGPQRVATESELRR